MLLYVIQRHLSFCFLGLLQIHKLKKLTKNVSILCLKAKYFSACSIEGIWSVIVLVMKQISSNVIFIEKLTGWSEHMKVLTEVREAGFQRKWQRASVCFLFLSIRHSAWTLTAVSYAYTLCHNKEKLR